MLDYKVLKIYSIFRKVARHLLRTYTILRYYYTINELYELDIHYI